MDKKLLVDCPTNDFECSYWDWRYHKCAMMAQGEGDPREECYSFDEGDDIQACMRESLGGNWW